jgi:hypothetical protein
VTAWTPRPPHPDEPACWSWPVPPIREAEAEIARAVHAQRGFDRDRRLSADVLRSLWDSAASLRWAEFHAGARASDTGGLGPPARCAVCGISGARDHLVQDHCHATGQVRGRLCRSCNVQEGRGSNPAVRRYRRVHPAAILDYYEPYYGMRWEWGWSWTTHPTEAAEAERTGIPRPRTPWPPLDSR